MSKTLWYPLPRGKQRSWLLGNGEVVTEPALEQSASGQKVRVVNTETSAYAKDMDTMILAAVEATAQAKNTYVWQPLHERVERMRSAADLDPTVNNSDLYLLRPGTEPNQKGETRLWWTFQHPEFPEIEAMLVVSATSHYGNNHEVVTKVVMPDTRITNLMETRPVAGQYEDLGLAWYYSFSYPDDQKMQTWGQLNPSSWTPGILGGTTWPTERQTVQHLLQLVDRIDALATIEVPDMRDIDDVKWMTLEVGQSNYNGAFRQSLTDYLSGASGVEQAVQLYNDLRDAMRGLGINMGSLSENDFQRALLENEESALRVEVGPVAGEEGGVEHTLRVHLASGTFSVTCPNRHASPDGVAVEWERVKTIAQLTGEEPALLAFAKEFGRSKDEARARKVMRDRMKGARED